MGSVKPVGNGNPSEAITHRHNKILVAALEFVEICYGFLILWGFVVNMFVKDKRFRVMDGIDKKELADARDRLWNLHKKPFGLLHRFCKLRDGTRLHYVLSLPDKVVEGKTGLVIFLHGFPDSWHVWHPLLRKAKLKENATLVAVDLPGYGGSDGVAKCDPGTVLEVVSEFIIHMRESYLSTSEVSRGPVIVVGHDWGCVIGARLAAEAPILADRFILSNGFAPAVARENFRSRTESAQRMMKTWASNPTNLRPLKQAFANLKPALIQILMSGYIFAFRLPWPFHLIPGEMGDHWIYRLLNAVAVSIKPKEPLSGAHGMDMLASSLGPSPSEIEPMKANDYIDDSDSEHLAYASTIKKRSATGGWRTKIKVYRDGLATQSWDKSMHMLWELNQLEQSILKPHSANHSPTSRRRSSSRVGLFDNGPPGSFGAATTIIWGDKDPACSNSISMDGVGDFFSIRGSHLINLSQAGHWTMFNKQGVDVYETMIQWALKGEEETIEELLKDHSEVRIAVQR